MSVDGLTSTGEFGTTLRNLFSPALDARFEYIDETLISGRDVRVYSYSVAEKHSDWQLTAGSESCKPGYRGRVWIDKSGSWVWRIRHYADSELCHGFPWRSIAVDISFDFVRIREQGPYLLPSVSSVTVCEKNVPDCSWNLIQFTNYHRFIGEGRLIADSLAEGNKQQDGPVQSTAGARNAGTLVWTGDLEVSNLLTIDQNRANAGVLSGDPFPDVPILIETKPELLVKVPLEASGWKKLVLQNASQRTVRHVQIDWKRVQE